MITPADLFLPEKFKSFRQNQFETACKIVASKKFAFLLDSPTGSGKSIIAGTVQRVLNKNIIYICTTKQLQDQLVTDFPYARVLKGRSNYPCHKYLNMFPNITAEICNQITRDDCGYKDRCAYSIAKRAAIAAPIAILNMSYFLTEINYGKTFSGAEYVVIDEFDSTEDQLMNFIELSLSKRQLDYMSIKPPEAKTKFEAWVPWANNTLKTIIPEIESIENEMESVWFTPDPPKIKRLLSLKRMQSKLHFFVNNVDDKWVWYPGEVNWAFKPVWIAPYANFALWRHIKKFMGMSATILEPVQAARNIGLTEFDYLAMPSPFPKENRPIMYEPCGNIVNKELPTALPQLARKIREIIDKHPTDKILIHTTSYMIRDYIVKNVNSDRFITHETINKMEKLEEYKKSPRPLIMLSPSMDRGVDLPYDQCRVVVICKVPYPNLGDPQISKRLYGSKDGSHWYAYNTIKTVIQMAGRGVRAVDDYAITYILDSQFGRLFNEHRNMFPQWFIEAIII